MITKPITSRWTWVALSVVLGIWGVVHYFANETERQAQRLASEIRGATAVGSNNQSAPSHSSVPAESAVEKTPAPQSAASEHASLAGAVLSAMQEADAQGGKLSKLAEVALKKRMAAASFAELAALLVELDASTASRPVREQMAIMAYEQMGLKDLQKALELGLTRIYSTPRDVRLSLYDLFQKWAWKQPQQAEDWLDQQIANGVFESQSSDDMNRPRNGFEDRMWMAMLAWGNIDAFAKRIANVPEDVRHDVIGGLSIGLVKPTQEAALFTLLRKYCDDKKLTNCYLDLVISRAADQGYENASRAIEHVDLPPDKLAKVVELAANRRIFMLSRAAPMAQKDFDEARAWVRQQVPAMVNPFTGRFLATIAETRRAGKYEETMRLLDAFKNDPGRDVIVASFIRGLYLKPPMVQSLPLVDTITDPAVREQTRAYLNQAIKP